MLSTLALMMPNPLSCRYGSSLRGGTAKQFNYQGAHSSDAWTGGTERQVKPSV